MKRLPIIILCLMLTSCAPVVIKKNGYTHVIEHRHVNPIAAYGFSHSYDEDGKLVDTNLVKGKSIGEAVLNMGTAAGAAIGVYHGLKAVEAGTEIKLP